MGTILFYIFWPAIWFYMPLFVRGRAVISVENEVLVVKNWFGPGFWQMPGGGIKFGEQPLEAINRELQEELGLEGLEGSMLTKEPVIFMRRGLLLRQHYALYRVTKKPEFSMSRELTSAAWVSVQDAPLPGAILRSLEAS